MTIRTACSSSLVCLNEACAAITKGDCTSAIVGGTSIIMAPSLTAGISEAGALSSDGSCKTFSSKADGYARGEAIVAIYVKSLKAALQEGNPIRAVIKGIATNCDGKTTGFSVPSSAAQESLIRHAYKIAGIADADIKDTGFFECHGTGTSVGDAIEATAVARVFGETGGIHIGSVKPNLGHGEAASGLTAVLKAVLALENRTLPPNIKCLPPSENIPFTSARLTVPTEATQWPEGRHERISVNSFGIGGANAHVILDSARSFGAFQTNVSTSEAAALPQLLIYSANHPQSLKEMTNRYSTFLEKTSNAICLADVAYTLANRREHHPFRSFAVSFKHRVGVASLPSPPEEDYGIVMVFTGQGAQWPQMGRDLLRANTTFRRTIKHLDGCLQDLGSVAPDWRIEDELDKPSHNSRINRTEFSQPLCTAFQVALVDMLASIGIKPAAVVGHSSGEIAAAYASGGLTAEEAIKVAFFRGFVAGKQLRLGAMSAIGASWEEVNKFLVPGVVMACDNSPKSVTISGDPIEVRNVSTAIKEAIPGVFVSPLKVEKAYHSSHMTEVGSEYEDIMENFGVEGKAPTLPFFSTVTGGKLVGSSRVHGQLGSSWLGPNYWRKNLECPVLFNAAVSSLLGDSETTVKNPIFVEVGPHAALSGPLRQIVTHQSKIAPYIPTTMRRQNSLGSFLTAVGKLWTFHINVDFKALMPGGLCLSGLPHYPWDHQRHYWKESRVSKEWRLRAYPYHDLLGAKVPESSSIDPMWRNVFHLDNAPWVRDHRIKDNIVYPFACYIAMAAEACRQVTRVEECVKFRHVVVSTALVLQEDSPLELVTTLRRHRLTDSLHSNWWGFTISSHSAHTWTEHCFGDVCTVSKVFEDAELRQEASLLHRVDRRQWYERVYREGLEYGDYFITMENLRTSPGGVEGIAIAEVKNNRYGDEVNYHLHPVIVDTVFQVLGAAAFHGFTHDYSQLIPLSVEHLAISRCSTDKITINASCRPQGKGMTGDGACVGDSATCLKASGVRLIPLDTGGDLNFDAGFPLTAHCEWVPHINFADLKTLVRSSRDHTQYSATLDLLGQFAISQSKRSLSENDITPAHHHLRMYKSWLSRQIHPKIEEIETADLKHRMNLLCASLGGSPAAHAADAITKVSEHIISIISGEKGAWQLLHADSTLDGLNKFLKEYDASKLLQCLAHSNPNLRILELGASTGDATSGILSNLKHASGFALYSQYVCTDMLPGLVASAQERFKGVPNVEFATLDIGQNPSSQSFDGRKFDLIIAAGVIHTTPNIQQSLKHCHQLLNPDGWLLLQQPRTDLLWLKYILGILPSWWCGIEDGRSDEPVLNRDRWEEELAKAGFKWLEGSALESPEQSHLTSIMMARVKHKENALRPVTIIHGSGKSDEQDQLGMDLAALGFQVSHCSMDQATTPNQDVIMLVDMDGPFFETIDSTSLNWLKILLENLQNSESSIFWVTKNQCKNPAYAMVFGFARSIRVEMGIDFATCEIDDMHTTMDVVALAKVYHAFQKREVGKILGPDFEYNISQGWTRVSRFFPFSYSDTHLYAESCDEAALRISRTGRLDSLHWVVQPTVSLKNDEVEIEVHSVGLNFRVSYSLQTCS